MKKFLIIVLICLAAVLSAGLMLKPVAGYFIEKELSRTFPSADISSGRTFLGLTGIFPVKARITVENPMIDGNGFTFKARTAAADVCVPRIFSGVLDAFSLDGGSLAVDMPERNMGEVLKKNNMAGPAFVLGALRVTGFSFDIKGRSLSLKGNATVVYDRADAAKTVLNVAISRFSIGDITAENVKLSRTVSGSVEVSAGKITYGDIGASSFLSAAALGTGVIGLSDIGAVFMSGKVGGSADADMDGGEYGARLTFNGVDILELMKAARADKKFEMTGKLTGTLTISGRGPRVEALSGEFRALEPGGMLVIKDEALLREMAERSKQNIDIVMESLKNYHYNKGRLGLRMEGGSLVADVALEGAAGRRDLSVVVHDFSPRKEE